MHELLPSIDAGTYVFLAITLLCLWWIKVTQGNQRNIRLIARASGGLVLVLLGISIILPELASPRTTSTGAVTDFHEVREYRSSHFEFRINGKDPVLSADYLDTGYYFGKPSVSDGDIVNLAYLSWTDEVIRIREIAGRHPGWEYQEDQRPVGPWLLVFGGILLVFGAIWGKLTDRFARSDGDPDAPAGVSGTA
jgi:hypothetical protein